MITEHPVGGDVPIGMNITLECEATGRGTLKFSWERHHAGNWTTISVDSTKSYTATTSGSYRCKASNEAGSNVSNRARVNIYGELWPDLSACDDSIVCRSSYHHNSACLSTVNNRYDS